MRIEKKGLCGLTDAPDSIYDPKFLQWFNPADPVGSLQKQVQVAQHVVDQKKSLMDEKQKVINQQIQNIQDAQASTAEEAVVFISRCLSVLPALRFCTQIASGLPGNTRPSLAI